MHTFQPFSINDIDLNPFNKLGKEWALITAGSKHDANCMTVSWGGLGVMWGKNSAFIFIRESRYTKEFIDKNDVFSISFFDESYRDALNYCGSHSGRDVDKFEEANLTIASKHGIPFPDEANLVLICKKMAAVELDESTFCDKAIKEKFYADNDMHTMYVGEILVSMAR
ncbi:flavin reductase family protein [Lachnobacterium bovis]|uniref:flavin reductase family protein n=1 Tax=Lachnobacterium bovis TaxID=140626 RepID=UPI000481ECD6|nr:flavin reductase family protein [Lachnobacterium bovis]